MYTDIPPIKENTQRFDNDSTRLTFTFDNTKEDHPMTKEELVVHIIQHAETFPDVGEITAAATQEIIGNLAPSPSIPEITADEFVAIWNRSVHDPEIMTV